MDPSPSNILVVDDEPLMEYVIRQKFREEIRFHRYQFTFASNGKQALEQIHARNDLDLILTDIRMPEMDGLTLLRKLKELNASTQAVVISAYGDIDNIRAAMNQGAFDFLIKPLDLNDLEITVKKTLAHMRCIRQDQRKLKETQNQLKHLAYHDGLTGLANRDQFMYRLNHAMDVHRRKPEQGYAVLFIDLDRFKLINDSFGHQVGDQLLRKFAQALQRSIRGCDIVSRFGGDEFIVLMEQFNGLSEVLPMVSRIQEITREEFALDQYKISISVSIGITSSSQGYRNSEDVVRDADVAMYRAKREQGTSYAIFDPAMQRSVANYQRLESGLRRAIRTRDIQAHYQPIYSLKDGQLSSFEVLARWLNRDGRWISPREFIPISEESGLINGLSWQLVEQACGQMREWHKQRPNLIFTLNINISMLSLAAKDFVPVLEDILTKTGLHRKRIKLEITETSFMSEIGWTRKNLQQLSDRDYHLCIDDFGTGYSSLNRLYLLPVRTLKIDQSFIRSLYTDQRLTKLVTAIIALGHSLGLHLVAEGVETMEELEVLKNLGCDYAQGYLMHAPMPAEAATELVKKEDGVSETETQKA